MSLKAIVEDGMSIFDEYARTSVIEEMTKFIDMWMEDDQFNVTYDLDQNDALTDIQLRAIRDAFVPHFERLHLKTGYLLVELLVLKMHKAKCEMLHGG